MTVKITQIDGWKLKAEADGFAILSGRADMDSPSAGMSPGRLMAASLGMCTGMHLVGYMQKNNLEYSDLVINVETKNERNPGRCGQFTTQIKVKADLDEEQMKGLRDECNRCYVGNTIKNHPEVRVSIETD